ncbi:retinitis pigmentosa 1-like 1 protein [Callorhinchus milii]|uniref:retinitis pigmentosa 1-like 1 protein n=1 Tax=Callorhinchus milii TaxID=7868 RepID=UPI001C3F5C3E|nr:retinitis pigmentosa 1-like 1 protein [Callorhinchus milii]
MSVAPALLLRRKIFLTDQDDPLFFGLYLCHIPLNYEQPLPPVAKSAPLTEVTPAKKITFYRSGHPQQSGVKMAVNKRVFKTFDALLDDLSQRVSLPFCVRTVTTPRGVHSISTLEQLEDGGSYLCSDKKSIKQANANAAVRKPASQQGPRPTSARRRAILMARQDEDHSHHIHKGPKKITMIKNGDADIHHSIILNKRNAQNFRNFLDEISELMQYNVRKLYTVEGRKIDNLQALFHCPSVLVCVGHEPFKPVTYENLRRNPSEKLPGLSMRSRASIASESFDSKKNANFGLEAKKSVIHPRSPSRSPRISLSSHKSYPNGLNMSSGNSGYASFMDSCPHEKNGEFATALIDDDIEKKVHVNKDGSLSVEMKVRFRLLNDETLQWSTQIRRSSLPRKSSCDRLCFLEDQVMEKAEQMNPNNGSEVDEPFCSCDADDSYISKLNDAEHAENLCQNCCNQCQEYDIWKNPIYVEKSKGEETHNVTRARSSCSTTSSCRRITQKKESIESLRTTSSEEYTQHIVQEAVCYSKTAENGDDNRVKYCSLRRCSCQNSSTVSASDMGKNHESRESTSSSHRASSRPSTGRSHQNNAVSQELTDKQTFVNVSPSPSTANSKKNSAIKSTDVRAPSPTSSMPSQNTESTAEEYRPVSQTSKSSAGSKQTKDEKSSEERAHSVTSSCSSHSAKCSDQSVGNNHLSPRPISAASSCPSQTSRKASAMDNMQDAEEVRSIMSSYSHNHDKNLQEATPECDRPKSKMSLSSGRSNTDKQEKQDVSESENQSRPGSSFSGLQGSHPELHVQDSDNNARPISSVSHLSKHFKQSKQGKVKMDSDVDSSSSVILFSSVSSAPQNTAPSLAPEEEARPYSNASCSEISNGKNKVKLTVQQPSGSTFSEPLSLNGNKELNVANSDNESIRPSSSESGSCCNSKRNKSRMTKSEAESRPSTPASSNSKADPNLCAEKQANDQDQRPMCSPSRLLEFVQVENNVKMESKGSDKASSICYSVSKASKAKIKSKQVKDESEETNAAKVELSSATVVEDAAVSVIDSASDQSTRQPSPPKGKPGAKNGRQLLKSSSQKSRSSIGTCSIVPGEITGEKPPESKLNVLRSKSNLSEKSNDLNSHKADENINNKSVREKTSERGSKKSKCKHGHQIKKDHDENHTSTDACEKNDFIPSELPNASLEEVVHTWLQKIPSENLLVTYEEFKEGHEKPATNVTPEGTKAEVEEATTTLDESKQETIAGESEPTEKNDLEAAKLEDSGSLNADNNDTMEGSVKDVVETSQAEPVNSGLSVTAKPNNPQNRDLPNNAHSSIQIMKVLLFTRQGAKLDRSNSLPELSPELEKKLSKSAKSLLTCLGNLHLFDEESLHSKDKSPNSNNSRYEELLGILRSLWLTGIAEGDENEALHMAGNHSKPFKVHNSVDKDITPMSSSGVDVSSGSGGSGEDSIGGTVNTSLSTEKIKCDLAIKTCTIMNENSTKIKQPHSVKTSSDEKDEQYSTSTRMSNVCCRKQKLRSCESSQYQSQESNIGNRSETRQLDAVSSSPVTPDIAYRVQWSSGGKSINNYDPDENTYSDTAEKPQDTIQNIKDQTDPSTDVVQTSDRESCSIQETIHQSETTNHNRPEDVEDLEEQKSVDNKITEECNNVDVTESPEQISKDKECTVQNRAEEKGCVPPQKISPDPEPAWVMKLLQKIEKQFIAHYVDAMNDFKIKWNLENNDTLDQMIADLREEVSRRIQASIKKELRKVQGRSGKKVPRPPQDQIRRESSEQTDQRRRRLRAMYKQSNCDDNKMNNAPADANKKNNYEQNDTDLNEQLSSDEFCPCESCAEKSKASKPEINPVQSFAPVVKYFDLREILKLNKASKNVEKNGSDTSELLDRVSNKQEIAERESIGSVQNKDNTELKSEDGDNMEVKTEDEENMEDKMEEKENVEDKTEDEENVEVKTEGEDANDKTEDGKNVEETEDEENAEVKTEDAGQDDESVTENQENINNETESHGSDETSHQDEAEETKGDLDKNSNLQDIDEEQNLVEKCEDELESPSGESEGSVNIKSDDAKEPTEDRKSNICKNELQQQEDGDNSEGISKCSECKADNMKHTTEECTTTPEANGEQENQNEDNNPLLEDDSDTIDRDNSQDNVKETTDSNVSAENLDEVSELSDEHLESDFVKNQNEEEVEEVGVDGKITTEHTTSPDISCQVQAAEVQQVSAMEAPDGDCVQMKSGEGASSTSDKTVPRATQMYPESSSDDDRETICNSPEEPAHQKDGEDTESDKQVSPVNKSKQPVNEEFDAEDLDF